MLLGVFVTLPGCPPDFPTEARLRAAVAAYVEGKVEPTEAQIDALFARLDADIAALRAEAATDPNGDAAKRAQALQEERTRLWRTYLEAKLARVRNAAGRALRDLGKEMGKGIEEAGRRMQESMDGSPAASRSHPDP
jgi:HEAT repeat protein